MTVKELAQKLFDETLPTRFSNGLPVKISLDICRNDTKTFFMKEAEYRLSNNKNRSLTEQTKENNVSGLGKESSELQDN